MNNTCLIYSPDGFDLCVLNNQIDFYRLLGFNVFYSNKIHPANLLVILRGKSFSDEVIRKINESNYSQIHVFDYAGQQTSKICKDLLGDVVVVAPSMNSIARDIPDNKIIITHPYISLERWVCRRTYTRKNELIHIGNYKAQSDGDMQLKSLNKFINRENVTVYGSGWANIIESDRNRGPVRITEVPRLYTNHKYAIGIMHPFQRDNTYSSRFWLAPLNGCLVLSEDGLFSGKIPGVYIVDYSDLTINNLPRINCDDIAKTALQFWSVSNKCTFDIICETLSRRKYTDHNISLLSYYRHKAKNHFYTLIKDPFRIFKSRLSATFR